LENNMVLSQMHITARKCASSWECCWWPEGNSYLRYKTGKLCSAGRDEKFQSEPQASAQNRFVHFVIAKQFRRNVFISPLLV